MRLRHTKVYKGLGSLLVALILATMPVQVMAAEQPADTTGSSTTQSTTNSDSTAASAQTASPNPAPTPAPASAPASNSDQQSTSTSSAASTTASPQAQTTDTTTSSSASGSSPAGSGQSNTNAKTSASSTTAADPTITLGNTVKSDAASGNATASKNDGNGDAATGNANAGATVLNLANASGVSAGNIRTFNCDITQDLQQNITIDPSSLQPMDVCANNGASTAAPAQGPLQGGASLTDILNTIALNATSGQATAAGNDGNGTAASGDATALANVVNIANSAISARNSFLGVINVYGQLQGNIQVPQSFVDSLVKTGTVNTGSSTTDIINNLNAAATSGNATASDNNGSGSAASGDASTSVTVMNLTGQQVVAKNSLLVFVNVLGKWTGFILPAKGSNTALLGGGLQSAQQATALENGGSNATHITNNISVNAASGDANATGNDGNGTATSGKASAGINLLNISGSDFQLDDWFGALFINVIGRWIGDFAIQQAGQTPGDNPQPPVQDVKILEVTEPMTVTPATSPTASFKPITRAGEGGGQTLQVPDAHLTAVTKTGKVLGATTGQFHGLAPSTDHKVTFDPVSMVAVIMALTLLLMLGTVTVRHLARRP